MSSFDDLERRFWDLNAASREQSYVGSETYDKLHEIADAAIEAAKVTGTGKGGDTRVMATLAVEQLSADELEDIVADWLEGRGNVGSL